MQPPPGKPRVPPPPPGGSAGLPPPPNRPAQPGPVRTAQAPAAPAYAPAPAAAPYAAPAPAAAPYAAPSPGWGGEVSPALAAQAMQMPRLRKRPNLGFLRFFAGACVGTAWLNVVLTILLTIGAFGAGASLKAMLGMLGPLGGATSSLPSPGGMDDPFSTPGASPTPQVGPALLQGFADQLNTFFVIGGILNILMGICLWIFFMGLAKLTYGYIELEEQATRDHEAVQILLANLGRG